MVRFVLLAALGLVVLASGCGDDDDGASTATPETAVASPTVAGAAPTATPTREPSPTVKPVTAADSALAAALAKYNGIARKANESCSQDNAKKQACLALTSSAGAAERGTAAITVADAAGVGGFVAIFGRNGAGAWDLWFGTQNVSFHVWELPADMLVCADGDGLNVRKAPGSDSPIVTLLKDLATVRAEEFVLAAATNANVPGTGWYRISSPVEGWAHSNFLSDAKLKDCAVRDIQVKP